MKHSRPSSSGPARIDCGGCHGCCHQLVIVLPDEAPPPGGWRLDAARAPLPVLERRAEGSCVYLDPLGLGCSIYPHRPRMCREFHCGLWYATLSPAERSRIAAHGDAADREMLASGRRHTP